jgi:hypothetical protein
VGETPGWVTAAALIGTIFAVCAIGLSEGFVAASVFLNITVGEFELLAAVAYVVAIIGYAGSSGSPSGSSRRRSSGD